MKKAVRNTLTGIFMAVASQGYAQFPNVSLNSLSDPNDFTSRQEPPAPPKPLRYVFSEQAFITHAWYQRRIRDWRQRTLAEGALSSPEIDNSPYFLVNSPMLNGDNAAKDFNRIRSFFSTLRDREYNEKVILNYAAFYAVQYEKYYYKPDNTDNDAIMRPMIYGTLEDWETPLEVLAEGGDDCDGLATLVRQWLEDGGIPKNETYLLFLNRKPPHQDSASSHMVTVWNDPASPNDPIIIDSTGYISDKPYRYSDLYIKAPDHEPLFQFNEYRTYNLVSTHEIVPAAKTPYKTFDVKF